MNERLTQLYRSCRTKEALVSQDQYQASNVLLGSEVEKFAELIVQECCQMMIDLERKYPANLTVKEIKEHFGVNNEYNN